MHLPFDRKKIQIQNEHIKQVNANIYLLNALTSNYSHFVPILTLRRDNSGIVLCKVRIPTLRNKVRIPTLRRTIPELYRFLLCAEHIHAVQSLSQLCKGEVGLRSCFDGVSQVAPEKRKTYKSLHLHLLVYLKQSTVFTTYYIDKHLVIIMVTSCLVLTVNLL